MENNHDPLARTDPAHARLGWLVDGGAVGGGGASVEALVLIVVVAALAAVAGAWSAWRAVAVLRADRRAVARERHDLNRTMTYQHPRSIR